MDMLEAECASSERKDRAKSPKLDFVDRCILLYQLLPKAPISTSANSEFSHFVSLLFELATGEQGNALPGAVRTGWKTIREVWQGIHPDLHEYYGISENEKEANIENRGATWALGHWNGAAKLKDVRTVRNAPNRLPTEYFILSCILGNCLLHTENRTSEQEAELQEILQPRQQHP